MKFFTRVPGHDAPPPGLVRMRLVATGLLVLMATLFLVAREMGPVHPAFGFLRAFAEAAMVGGLADWFAVTALFRHPLGLPIPHTAILPAQKARLGRALGRFVANHVFTGAEVSRALAQLDLPGILRRFLSDSASARPAAQAMAEMLPGKGAAAEAGMAAGGRP
jgi:uncharacterized membrane-anchored protein YjiN (DUF445 family)